MRMNALIVSLVAISLTACGGESPDPVEQIVVAEPGETAPAEAASGDLVAAGEKAFAVCKACHAVDSAAGSGIGPNLAGVVGRKAGALDGFGYSDAMASSGITWSAAELDGFLENPSAKVPGTTMAAGAERDPQRRAAIIAYLASLAE